MHTNDLQDRDYLGDGVYVGHDGYHVVLWLEYPGGYDHGAITLEPPVLAALERYRERVMEAASRG